MVLEGPMNLLDRASNHATYRKHSTAKGGEYVGPCPVKSTCNGAGDDRFHIWPEQDDHGTWWCRICGKGGDAIQFLIEVEGKSFLEACSIVGKEAPEQQEYRTPAPKRKPEESWRPTAPASPADKWLEHAEKFVDFAHEQLLAAGDGPGTPLEYLAGRGISRAAAVKHRLGWNPGEKGNDMYRAREGWGLETVLKEGGKKRKLWLPIGLVIPFPATGMLRRIRIRIPEGRRPENFKTPYYVVPGSAMDTFTINPSARAFFIVEAELDGILIDDKAGDLTGVMAMGNNSAKPTAEAHQLLTESMHIANALDYDLQTDSNDNPGGVAWLWWKRQFAQAERWPVPVGKDPGDAFKGGVDIRAWVKAGLPPALTVPPAPPERKIIKPAPNLETNTSAETCDEVFQDICRRLEVAINSRWPETLVDGQVLVWAPANVFELYRHLKAMEKQLNENWTNGVLADMKTSCLEWGRTMLKIFEAYAKHLQGRDAA